MQAPNQSISVGSGIPFAARAPAGTLWSAARYQQGISYCLSPCPSPTGGRGEGERVEKFEYALFPIAHLKPNIERSGITLIRPGKLENELIASFSKYAIFLISRSE